MGGIIDNFIGTVKNGLAFRGRTDRRDYWVFILTFLVILAVLLVVCGKDFFYGCFCKTILRSDDPADTGSDRQKAA